MTAPPADARYEQDGSEHMKNFVAGFREFILRGNVIDLAVGIVIGAAFGAVVNALVEGILNPFIGAIFASISALLVSKLRTVYSALSGWPSRTSKVPSGRKSDATCSGWSERMNFA